MFRRGAWVLVTAGLACATPSEQAEVEDSPSPAPSEVLGGLGFDGCERLVAERVCQRRGPGPLRVWLPGEFSVSRVEVRRRDGVPIEAQPLADPDGVLFRISDPRPGGFVVLEGERRVADFVVEPTPWAHRAIQWVTHAVHGGGHGPAYTRAWLGVLRTVLGPGSASSVRCLNAKVAFATEDWSRVLEYADAQSRSSGSDDAVCGATLHIQAAATAIEHQPDLGRAREHLRRATEFDQVLLTRAYADYFRGVLAQHTGQLDDAIAWFEVAQSQAQRIESHAASDDYRAQQAVLLSRLGRYEEARAVAAQIREPADAHVMSVVWSQILEREEDSRAPVDRERLQRSLVRFSAQPDSYHHHNALLNLAIVQVQDEDFEAARRSLDGLDPSVLTSEAVVFAHLTRARIALADARGDAALNELAEAGRVAATDPDLEFGLRVTLLEAQILQALGRADRALDAYRRADAQEERLAVGIAPQAGRSMFSRTWRRSRARRLQLLLDQGHRAEALCVVLGSRARYLRSLRVDSTRDSPDFAQRRGALLLERARLRAAIGASAKSSWKLNKRERQDAEVRVEEMRRQLHALSDDLVELVERSGTSRPWSCDEVRTSDADTVLVTMHPSTTPDRWWLFTDVAGDVRVVSVELPQRPTPAALGQLVESGLESLPASASRLLMVPLGPFASAELEDSAMLELGIERVAHSLGLGRGARGLPPATANAGVVLVGRVDDLRVAADEAREVDAALVAQGWVVDSRWSGVGGEPSSRPTLLHYAGHASHAGVNGWDSQLVLGDRELSISELIAVSGPPPVVVLGACEAASVDPHVLDGGINVASAFLLAGSSAVVAPTRAVDDRVARDFARWLYAQPISDREAELIDRLQASVFRAGKQQPAFASWRLLVP